MQQSRAQKPTISIVIPALNEARNLERILPTLPAVHEVILVDGNSIDDTVITAQRVLPEIVVVQQARRGKGNALACGFERATGDIVVMFDADGSSNPDEIPAFVGALLAGADFAKGSRFCHGGASLDITPFRRAGNSALNRIANRMFGTAFTDLCYGYNAFWADILPSLALPRNATTGSESTLTSWGDGFEIETLLNCRVAGLGLVVVEVPSIENLRVFGASNLNAIRDGLRVLRTLLVERRALLRRSTTYSSEPAHDAVAGSVFDDGRAEQAA